MVMGPEVQPNTSNYTVGNFRAVDAASDLNSISVDFYERKPYPGQYSIEASFMRIGHALRSIGVTVNNRTAPRFSRGLFARLAIALDARHHRAAKVLHVTGDIHFAVLLARGPVVLTIHDLEMLSRHRGWRRYMLKLFWFTLPCRRANRICVISNATKSRLLEEVTGIEDKIHVVPSIVSETLVPVSKSFNSQTPRILVIGTKKNKNLPRIAAAISGLPVTLVVLGQIDESLSTAFAEHNLDVEAHVGVDDAELAKLYASADILAMVSTEEGFGMPIVEAQRMGIPVVTSNVSSMPEVAGEGAVLVNPIDIASIRDGVCSLINNSDLRDKIIREGTKNAERFRAAAVAQTLKTLYADLARD